MEDKGKFVITILWVVTEKLKGVKTITQVRLVARGYEENTENLKRNLPTCNKESVAFF